MEKPLVVLIHNDVPPHRTENYERLVSSIEANNLECLNSTVHNGWSWFQRLQDTYAITLKNPNRPLVFVDAFDSLILGNLEELEPMLNEAPLWFTTQKNLWPQVGDLALGYERKPPVKSPWKYVNGCGPIGFGRVISEAMSKNTVRLLRTFGIVDMRRGPVKNTPAEDQTYWHCVYLDGYGKLDTQCRLTQNLYLAEGDLEVVKGKVRNKVTGTWPQIIHAAGQSSFPKGLV